MAVRLHLTAVRGSRPDRVREVFTSLLGPGFEQVIFHEHNGWLWFTTSVWGVKGSDLHEGHRQLGTAGLNITTEDGQRWYLALFGAGREPTYLLHDFCYLGGTPVDESEEEPREEEPIDPRLAFLEDDPLPPGPPRVPFDQVIDYYAGLGSKNTAEPFRAAAADLPLAEAFTRFQKWHAEQVADALAERGFSFNRERLTAVLRQEPPYLRNFSGDLGNLAWFLVELGLNGEWQASIAEAERWAAEAAAAPPPDDEVDDEQEEELPDEDEETLQLLAELRELEVAPIEGGPVTVPFEVLGELQCCAETAAIEETPMAWLLADLPLTSTQPAELPVSSPALRIERDGGHITARVIDPWTLARWGAEEAEEKSLFAFLRGLPPGTRLEYLTGSPDSQGCQQRFIGTLSDGGWALEASHPPLSTKDLSEVRELLRGRGQQRVECRDDAEADAFQEAVRRDGYLHNMDVRREGRSFTCQYDNGELARLLLRQRFGHIWDYAEVLAHVEQEYQERLKMEKQMRRAGAQAARNMAAPHDTEVLFQGGSIYWASDWSRLDQLNKDQKKAIEEGLAGLGYRHLGDFVCKRLRNDLRRCWLSPDGLAYAVAVATRFGLYTFEFFSQFADGSSLTTTTMGSDSNPDQGVFYKVVEWMQPAEMEAKHRWGLERFRQHRRTEPVPLPATLRGLVECFDVFLQRNPPQQIGIDVETVSLQEPEG